MNRATTDIVNTKKIHIFLEYFYITNGISNISYHSKFEYFLKKDFSVKLHDVTEKVSKSN